MNKIQGVNFVYFLEIFVDSKHLRLFSYFQFWFKSRILQLSKVLVFSEVPFEFMLTDGRKFKCLPVVDGSAIFVGDQELRVIGAAVSEIRSWLGSSKSPATREFLLHGKSLYVQSSIVFFNLVICSI